MQMQEGIVKNLKFLGEDGQPLPAGKSGKVPQYMARMSSRTFQHTTSAPEGGGDQVLLKSFELINNN
jgi:hypothetical protein